MLLSLSSSGGGILTRLKMQKKKEISYFLRSPGVSEAGEEAGEAKSLNCDMSIGGED